MPEKFGKKKKKIECSPAAASLKENIFYFKMKVC